MSQRITLILLLFLLFGFNTYAQKTKPDSLRKLLTTLKTDSDRVDILGEMAFEYAQNKPDSELMLASRALLISRRIKYFKGEMKSLKLLAEAHQFLGNYPEALKYYLERLKLDEENPDAEREVATMLSIANLYQLEGDYKQALNYSKKGDALIRQHKLEDYKWYSYMGLAEIYSKLKDTTNAIACNKKAYELAVKKNDAAWIGMCLNNTANVYAIMPHSQVALDYYRRAVPYLIANNVENFLCESYNGIATILFQNGRADSAVFYAKKALNLSVSRKFNERSLKLCQLLTNIYKAKKLPDSALNYQDKILSLKDSIFSQEKERQIASLTIAEEIRQKDRAQERIDEEKERHYKLSLLLVGLLIPTSFLVSLILSKRKMHHRVIEFSGIISLLLLFEYLTILLHPLVVEWTHHSPFLEIVIFVGVAGILTPSHHRLEHWMLTKLTKHKHHPTGKGNGAEINSNTNYTSAEGSTPINAPK